MFIIKGTLFFKNIITKYILYIKNFKNSSPKFFLIYKLIFNFGVSQTKSYSFSTKITQHFQMLYVFILKFFKFIR